MDSISDSELQDRGQGLPTCEAILQVCTPDTRRLLSLSEFYSRFFFFFLIWYMENEITFSNGKRVWHPGSGCTFSWGGSRLDATEHCTCPSEGTGRGPPARAGPETNVLTELGLPLAACDYPDPFQSHGRKNGQRGLQRVFLSRSRPKEKRRGKR